MGGAARSDSSGSTSGSALGFLKKVLGKTVGSAPLKLALDVADTPRAVIVSSAKELSDLSRGHGASLGDLYSQTRHHVGVGDLLTEVAPNMNINARRALGFVGDVGADPLTYLTFGASAVAKGGIKAGTRLAAKDVADLALAAGRNDLANKVLRGRSAALLSAADKAELGIKTVPRIGLGTARVDLPFLEGISKGRAALTEKLAGHLVDNKAAASLRKATNPIAKAMVDLQKTDPASARQFMRATRLASGLGDGLKNKALKGLGPLNREFGKAADPAEITRLMEDEGARLAATGPARDAADNLAAWYEEVRTAAEAASGRDIPKLDNYVPHQMLAEYREAMADAGKHGHQPAGRQAFELRRQNRVGSTWFGETLETGSLKEMNDIAERAMGSAVFRDDPWAIATAYANSVGRMVSKQRLSKELVDRGLVQKFDKELLAAADRTAAPKGATVTAELAKADRALADIVDSAPTRPDGASLGAAERELAKAESLLADTAGAAPDLAKHEAKLASIDSQIEAAHNEIADITKADAAARRAADFNGAELKKKLDYTRIGFRNADAADAMRATGDGDLVRLADELGAGRERRAVLGEARRRIDEIASQSEVAKNARFKNSIDIEGVGGKIEGSSEAVAKVKKLEAQVAKLTKAREAASQALQDAKDVAPVAAADTSKLAAAVEKAQAKVAAERLQYNQAQAAYGDWETSFQQIVAQRDAAVGAGRDLLDRAVALGEAAASETDPAMAQVARLESVALAGEATAGATDPASLVGKMDVPARREDFNKMVAAGFSEQLKTDPTMWASSDLAAVVAEYAERATPQEVGKFWQSYDAVLNRWKAYALMSPGFHARNWLGAKWNNWMAGVDHDLSMRNVRMMHSYKRGGADLVQSKFGEKAGFGFREMERLNVFAPDDIMDLGDIGRKNENGIAGYVAKRRGAADAAVQKLNKFDPTSMRNAAVNLNFETAGRVERLVRAELFMDRIFKGFTPEMAMDDVIKYHFDYSELSQLEKGVAKRVIPFYTWTRKNLPLQVENYVRNPQKFNRFYALKRNTELGAEEDPIVPGYFHDLMGIKVPLTAPGGKSVYMTPDLPINRIPGLGEPFDDTFWNGLSPAFKLPLELRTNKSFFTGAPLLSQGEQGSKIPTTWLPLAPILHQLDGLGGLPKVERIDGHYRMDRRESYKVEQALPLLGKVRRLLPNEPKYQDRALTSWLSILAGVNARTLTDNEIKSEMARRTRS